MSATVDIPDVRCIAHTNMAILIEREGFEEEREWVPQSQIDDDSEVWKTGDEGTLVVSKWLAEKRGWL